LDKNWAGPPLFPCRWIGVSFNIPSSNIVSVFFLLHRRNLSTKCVCGRLNNWGRSALTGQQHK
jgi:hypothetical protein